MGMNKIKEKLSEEELNTAFKRLERLWFNLLDQLCNQAKLTQTSEQADLDALNILQNAIRETYFLIKPRLTQGNNIILNRQYALAAELFKILEDYAPRDANKLIAKRRELDRILKLRL